MGRFDEIKNKINANINENGEQRITGQVLNEVLIDEVNTIDEVISELEESIGQGGGGGGGDKEVYTIIWYGNDTPSSLIEDNKKAFEAFVSGKDVSFRVVLMANNLPIFLTPDKIEYTGGTSMLIRASSAETHYGTTAGLGIIRYSMMLYNDGHIDHIGMDRFDVPTTDDVAEMIDSSIGDINTILDNINGEEV